MSSSGGATVAPRLGMLIVGAAKSGTTSLLRLLGQHPDVLTHRPPLNEMTYFARDDEYSAGFDAAFARYFGTPRDDSVVAVGKHAMAMYSSRVIERVSEHDPDVQVVAILRDPVDRAYSHYWFARSRGWESAATFDEAVEREGRRPPPEVGVLRTANACRYLADGEYAAEVRRLLGVFGSNAQVYLTSDLERELDVARELYASLGLDPTFTPRIVERHNPGSRARSELIGRAFFRFHAEDGRMRRLVAAVVPSNIARTLRSRLIRLNQRPTTAFPAMRNETRRALVAHFAPHNAELEEVLDRPLTEWAR